RARGPEPELWPRQRPDGVRRARRHRDGARRAGHPARTGRRPGRRGISWTRGAPLASDERNAMRVTVSDVVSPSYFPLTAAVELGFFKAEGLDAEFIFPPVDPGRILADGDVDF